MENIEIRKEARKAGVMLWQIAEALGITDSTFSRQLRREFTEEKKALILEIIREVAEGEKQHD